MELGEFRRMGVLYYLFMVFILFVLWSDLMILRVNLYVALIVSAVVSVYATRYLRQKKFFG